MARRKKVMGLPIGPKRSTFPLGKAAGLGMMGATALAAVPAAQKGMKVMQKGHEVVDQAGHAAEVVGNVKDAVSSHSSTVGKAAGLIGAVTGMGKKGDGKPKLSHLIEEHTDISVPRTEAYNQWTQMEMFPRITKGIASVDQTEDSEAQWSSKIGPVKRQWKAKITEQVPDERIAWKSDGGPEHEGVVTFHSLDDDLTRVLVEMHYVPHGPFEVVANKLRVQRRRVRRDLRLFKHFLELRGEATGAWRGRIDDGSTDDEGGDRGEDRSSRSSGSGSEDGDGHKTEGRSRARRAPAAKKATSGSGGRSSRTSAASRSNGAGSSRSNGAGSGRSTSSTRRRSSSTSSGRAAGARKSNGARAKAGSR